MRRDHQQPAFTEPRNGEPRRACKQPGGGKCRLARLTLLLLLSATVAGCSLWSTVTGQERRSREQARQLDVAQHTCQRYADGYAGKLLETFASIRRHVSDPKLGSRVLGWEISQVNSVYTIATGPNPIICHLDFVVLATLSRMMVEDTLTVLDEDLMGPLATVYRDLEHEAWVNVATVLTPEQVKELEQLIVDWRARNPNVLLVGFVHFSEFAQAAGWSSTARSAPGSVFGLIGIDPLAGLDPAVKQIEQTRLLAERVIFYMQRAPYLFDLQTERAISQATLAPQVERANASLERASIAMRDFATLGTALPESIAREREMLIRQLSGEMLAQEAELRGLLADLQSAFAAGTGTADAVNSTIVALDQLMSRFPQRAPDTEPADGRPFDITEYTAAAAQFAVTARQLTDLLGALGRESEPVAKAVSGGIDASREVVDYLFRRALLLGLLLISGGLAAALVYRSLVPRLQRPAGGAPESTRGDPG